MPTKRNPLVPWLLVFIVVLVLIVAAFFFASGEEDGRQYVAFMLLIPVVQASYVVWKISDLSDPGQWSSGPLSSGQSSSKQSELGTKCLHLTLSPFILIFLMVIAYASDSFKFISPLFLSILCMAAAIGIAIFTFWGVRLLFNKDENGDVLRTEVGRNILLVTCIFLTLFLCSSYLTAFGLAFLYKASKNDEAKSWAVFSPDEIYGEIENVNDSSNSVTLQFDENLAKLDIDDNSLRDYLGSKENDEKADPADSIGVSNALAISEIIKQIDHSRWKFFSVILRGYSTDTPLSDVKCASGSPVRYLPYQSNYELSEARIYRVQIAIAEIISSKFSGISIDWLLLPMSNEETVEEEKPKVTVDVRAVQNPWQMGAMGIQSPRHQLNLFDFFYFSINTLTASGNGDIIPVSPDARFATSLLNLVQILFVVIFFNVLFSFKKIDDDEGMDFGLISLEVDRRVRFDVDPHDTTILVRGTGDSAYFQVGTVSEYSLVGGSWYSFPEDGDFLLMLRRDGRKGRAFHLRVSDGGGNQLIRSRLPR